MVRPTELAAVFYDAHRRWFEAKVTAHSEPAPVTIGMSSACRRHDGFGGFWPGSLPDSTGLLVCEGADQSFEISPIILRPGSWHGA